MAARRGVAGMTARPDHEGDEAMRCGGCGARDLMLSCDGKHAICMICRRLQEPETRDWPESVMCDNCAFRKGSPERADPWRWMQVQETVEFDTPFHCHKGLQMTLHGESLSATFTAPDPYTDRMTVCAGWLASNIAKYKRKEADHG
jgi:hypothetical protein